MLWFLLGLIIGVIGGVFITASLAANRIKELENKVEEVLIND